MNKLTSERFANQVAEWAKTQFALEVRSDFRKAAIFDFPLSRRMLTVLRERPRAHVELLSRVLPLQVLTENQDSLKRRRALPREQREVVEQFREDWDASYRKCFSQDMELISYVRQKTIRPWFNDAVRQGAQLVKELASKAELSSHSGARGEWALSKETCGLRMLISFKLTRWLELQYGVSISDMPTMHNIWHNGQYLADLGLTYWNSSWSVNGSEEFPAKLLRANEFAMWHLGEYEKIVAELVQENPTKRHL